jgi:UDP-glucose 4-epimerase
MSEHQFKILLKSGTSVASEEEVKKKKILIIGISGGLAQILSRLILKKEKNVEILGIDSRSTSHCPRLKGLNYQTMKYSRGNFENLFRSHEFDVVYHLARITSAAHGDEGLTKRLDLNLMGTNRILNLCLKFNVSKIIILSTFHVYGALPDNMVFLPETAPLKASIKYPDLRDVVEMDQICTNWIWKHQKSMETIVLRPCSIIGTQINNAITRFLSSKFSLFPIDFNPTYQFIHEFDMANVLYQAIEKVPFGVYNVAPNDYISLQDALDRIANTNKIPFPVMLGRALNTVLKPFGMDVPNYFIDYLKYSCLIETDQIKKYLGEDFCRYNVKETLDLISMR